MPGETIQGEPQAQQQAQAGADPFQVDEAVLATLSPEQRQTFDPLIGSWKSKAQEQIKSQVESERRKYDGYDTYKQKAAALEQLANDPRFQQFWRQVTQPQTQQQQNKMVANPEEWNSALQELAAGTPDKWVELNQKQMMAWAQPVAQNLVQAQQQIQGQMELQGLFKRHPDAEELDDIGREKTDDPSLLQWAIYNIVDKNKGTLEDAYKYARRMADSFSKKSKQEALGMVEEKKKSVTEGAPKTSKDAKTVIELGDSRQALRESIKAAMSGRNVTYTSKMRVLK